MDEENLPTKTPFTGGRARGGGYEPSPEEIKSRTAELEAMRILARRLPMPAPLHHHMLKLHGRGYQKRLRPVVSQRTRGKRGELMPARETMGAIREYFTNPDPRKSIGG